MRRVPSQRPFGSIPECPDRDMAYRVEMQEMPDRPLPDRPEVLTILLSEARHCLQTCEILMIKFLIAFRSKVDLMSLNDPHDAAWCYNFRHFSSIPSGFIIDEYRPVNELDETGEFSYLATNLYVL